MRGGLFHHGSGKLAFEPFMQEHLQACLDIYKHYVENSTATFHTHVPSREEFMDIVCLGLNRNRGFVIRSEDHICGYVVLARYSPREAYADTGSVAIYLSPADCGRGIGSAALRFIEDYAVKKGFHALIATICAENTDSIRLFERGGYNRCAHYREAGRKFNRYLDVVAYQKIIEQP